MAIQRWGVLTALACLFTAYATHRLSKIFSKSAQSPQEQEKMARELHNHNLGMELIATLSMYHGDEDARHRKCQSLIQRGALLTLRDRQGNSALDIAVESKLLPVITLLVRSMAYDPRVTGTAMLLQVENAYSFHKAACENSSDAITDSKIENYLAEQVDLIQENNWENRAPETTEEDRGLILISLIRNSEGADEIALMQRCRDLLKSGANLTMRDDNQYSAFDWASAHGFEMLFTQLSHALLTEQPIMIRRMNRIFEKARHLALTDDMETTISHAIQSLNNPEAGKPLRLAP